MTLIASVSGIRGTIGGLSGDNLTPIDIVAFASAYGQWLQSQTRQGDDLKVAIGRDARPSGDLVQSMVSQTLMAMGINVLDLGLSTTPTVEMAVVWESCDGGIIVTASHNPVEWNALKLLNARGEFLSQADGEGILEAVHKGEFTYA
ncbi:MAG: phosphoglucosamine mutase, partial [Flavobacteriales bacterium]|nr:phosphoglucosamine mutase [Flavobacteriales bacterium]